MEFSPLPMLQIFGILGGVVLYVMLSGERAFESQSKVEVGAVKSIFWMYIIGMKLIERY